MTKTFIYLLLFFVIFLSIYNCFTLPKFHSHSNVGDRIVVTDNSDWSANQLRHAIVTTIHCKHPNPCWPITSPIVYSKISKIYPWHRRLELHPWPRGPLGFKKCYHAHPKKTRRKGSFERPISKICVLEKVHVILKILCKKILEKGIFPLKEYNI